MSLPAAAGEPAKVASQELAVSRRDSPRRVQDARKRVPRFHKRNTDLQSVRTAESTFPAAVNISVLHLQHPNVYWVLHSAEGASNGSLACAGDAATAGYQPAGRTGNRPVFHRNTDLQSVRPAQFYCAECDADRQMCV